MLTSAALKSLLVLMTTLIHDESVNCSTADRERDMEYIRSRVKHEGLSFLTITLPKFGASFVRGLENGRLDTSTLTGFSLSRTGLPRFLGGFLIHVFDAGGILRNEPCVLAISLIRQITSVFKKIELDCTDDRKRSAVKAYKQIEVDLTSCIHDVPSLRTLRSVAANLDDMFAAIARPVEDFSLRPRHGPGATADPSTPNSKWVFEEWPSEFEWVFPYSEYAVANPLAIDDYEKINFLEPGSRRPAKVCLVPKTLETPRVICIEPVYNQFVQQALRREFYYRVENHPIVGGQVNFSDQSINNKLALEGSEKPCWATLDLKDASDRVSLELVEAVFGKSSLLHSLLMLTRSERVELPDGDVLPLKKFASMGSALCFPVEAICFFVIAVAAMLEANGKPPDRDNFAYYAKLVYVYGDDIIVPIHYVDAVVELLERYHLRVNRAKSFWTGKFRESCGGDYYYGTDVTPIYCRKLPPNGPTDPSVISWIEFSNQLYLKGLWRSSSYVRKLCDRAVGYAIPYSHPDTEGSAYVTFLDTNIQESSTGFCKKLHKPIAKKPVAHPIRITDRLDGYEALHKCLSLPVMAKTKTHLEESVRRGDFTVRHRKAALVP